MVRLLRRLSINEFKPSAGLFSIYIDIYHLKALDEAVHTILVRLITDTVMLT